MSASDDVDGSAAPLIEHLKELRNRILVSLAAFAAVSYTHLDVYKRQDRPERLARPWEPPRRDFANPTAMDPVPPQCRAIQPCPKGVPSPYALRRRVHSLTFQQSRLQPLCPQRSPQPPCQAMPAKF